MQVWHARQRNMDRPPAKEIKSEGAFSFSQTVHRYSVLAGLHLRHIARPPSSSVSDLRASCGNSASFFSLWQILHSARLYSLCKSHGEHHDTSSPVPSPRRENKTQRPTHAQKTSATFREYLLYFFSLLPSSSAAAALLLLQATTPAQADPL